MNKKQIIQKIAHSRGNTTSFSTKVPVYIKLDSIVLDWFKVGGRGYQERINLLLKEYVEEVLSFQSLQLETAQQLFDKYYTQCFWHMKKHFEIKTEHFPLIIEGLKKYGGRDGYLESRKLCQ